MPASLIVKSVPTFRDFKGRFTRATDNLLQNRRVEVKEQARRALELFRDEAPEKTGTFKSKFLFRTFVEDNAVGFKIYTPQPLTNYIVKGTKDHDIPLIPGGKILRFYWAKGPKGPGVYFFNSVHHPGTKPNKFPGRAYRRWLPGGRGMLNRLSTRFTRDILR